MYCGILIRHANGNLSTNWYSKSTSAESILNYHSSHPHHQKINVATNLAKRVLQLSDKVFQTDNITKIKQILLKNNYPNKVINKIIHRTKHQLNNSNSSQNPLQDISNTNNTLPHGHAPIVPIFQQVQPSTSTNNNVQPITSPPTPAYPSSHSLHYNSLTYVPQLSDRIARIIKSHKPETKIAFKIKKTTKQNILTKTKQPINRLQHTNSIYSINCADNSCPTTYIGETKRTVQTRKTEHERDYRNRHLRSPKTALINHCLETGHTFDFDNITTIDREENQTKRRIIESAHIFLNKPNTCNYKQDTNNLNTNYSNLLTAYKSISPKFKNQQQHSNSN